MTFAVLEYSPILVHCKVVSKAQVEAEERQTSDSYRAKLLDVKSISGRTLKTIIVSLARFSNEVLLTRKSMLATLQNSHNPAQWSAIL